MYTVHVAQNLGLVHPAQNLDAVIRSHKDLIG